MNGNFIQNIQECAAFIQNEYYGYLGQDLQQEVQKVGFQNYQKQIIKFIERIFELYNKLNEIVIYKLTYNQISENLSLNSLHSYNSQFQTLEANLSEDSQQELYMEKPQTCEYQTPPDYCSSEQSIKENKIDRNQQRTLKYQQKMQQYQKIGQENELSKLNLYMQQNKQNDSLQNDIAQYSEAESRSSSMNQILNRNQNYTFEHQLDKDITQKIEHIQKVLQEEEKLQQMLSTKSSMKRYKSPDKSASQAQRPQRKQNASKSHVQGQSNSQKMGPGQNVKSCKTVIRLLAKRK